MAVMELRAECERCRQPLPNGSPDARICTFECTFCADCTDGDLNGVCPNCAGDLVLRPTRPAAMLDKYPAAAPSSG
ncbi:DUF1272 domain-containing protein [Mycolicibacterium stellerae]|uniref:DUF1272 domain-containing protein n=1 Tax=Mycolicibacterium stellerae TaxID=2358193 RepID=UPI000F0BD9A0